MVTSAEVLLVLGFYPGADPCKQPDILHGQTYCLAPDSSYGRQDLAHVGTVSAVLESEELASLVAHILGVRQYL